MNVVGYNMTKACADKVFSQAGFKPGEGRDQVGVVELHDCFASNEVRFAIPACRPTPDSHALFLSSSRMRLSASALLEKLTRWSKEGTILYASQSRRVPEWSS